VGAEEIRRLYKELEKAEEAVAEERVHVEYSDE
jgi:hypothetical protein